MKLNEQIAPTEALSIYLQDHYAGAQGGTALAQRAAENQKDTPAGPVLARLAEQIEEDESALRRVMDHLEVEPSRVKDAGAAIAEKLGRFKLNGQLTGDSPLSPVIEIEGLLSGVKSQEHVWEALQNCRGLDLGGVDPEQMITRVHEHIEALKTLWTDATTAAFPS